MPSRNAKLLACLLFCSTAPLMKSEPEFLFHAQNIPGVEVIYPRSDQFAAAIKTTVDPAVLPDIQDLLPFTYVLRNISNKTIIAYSSRWTLTDAMGHVNTTNATWWNLSTLTGGDVIEPKDARLVSPIFRLGVRSYGPTGATLQRQVERFASLFGSKSGVELSIDTVIFDDGTAFGPDLTNTVARAQAFLDAERQVADKSSFEIAKSLASTRPANRFTPLSNPPTYQECLAHYRRLILDGLSQVSIANKSDTSTTLSSLRHNVERKRGLAIVKKD